jgi:PAS domain S-box-containing protein
MHERELIGVIEIASMKLFRDFEIKFADEVAKSLAATMIYTRNNERTNELLKKSQQQAVEMAEQEEEMRQNMEELKATQEESARREEEYRSMVQAIESSILILEYDPKGVVTKANEKLCAFLGKSLKEVVGKTHQQVFGTSFDPDSEFWETLQRESGIIREEVLDTGRKKEKLVEHFASVVTENGTLKKYMNFILRG